ncbi:hypothetical protein BpHYR1_006477 [Brachionus plicatilis]|uniref:Uncharacterized protein n=1 Tax=Brachionus plicatilis TaxID=10195 RepID=A0A3M7T5F7_BRAPC|nr:hypothetical protein BpHYR1_006477 [Brachionus plicatilis]
MNRSSDKLKSCCKVVQDNAMIASANLDTIDSVEYLIIIKKMNYRIVIIHDLKNLVTRNSPALIYKKIWRSCYSIQKNDKINLIMIKLNNKIILTTASELVEMAHSEAIYGSCSCKNREIN